MNTIKAKSYTNIIEEYTANAAILPGQLVELMSTGKVRVHANAGQNALPMFAVEDDLQGNGIDDSYSADDKVQIWVPRRGDIVYAVLADGNDVSKGDFLESDGNGDLQKHTADVAQGGGSSAIADTTVYGSQIVGVALQTVDTSDSSGGESSDATLGYRRRIQVRVI